MEHYNHQVIFVVCGLYLILFDFILCYFIFYLLFFTVPFYLFFIWYFFDENHLFIDCSTFAFPFYSVHLASLFACLLCDCIRLCTLDFLGFSTLVEIILSFLPQSYLGFLVARVYSEDLLLSENQDPCCPFFQLSCFLLCVA